MIESLGSTLCADSGCTIQERFLPTIPKVLIPDKADYVMREVYERVCGNHLGAQLLVHKLIRAEYY